MTDHSSDQLDAKIAVVDHGEGHPILLVHGFPLDHTMWRHQIVDLANDYRVLAVDLPGFGASDSPGSNADKSPATPLSMEDYAVALAAVLDELQIEQPVTFCGLSMGGYIGWQFLNRYPDRVHSLIACDTRAANDDERTARGRRLMARQVVQDGSASVAAGMAKKICGQTTFEQNPAVVAHVAELIRSANPHSIAAGQLAMAERVNATPWLHDIRVPTLFVVGSEDIVTPPEEMRAMADEVPSARLTEIPYAGHLAPLENPAAFNTAVRSFLTSAS